MQQMTRRGTADGFVPAGDLNHIFDGAPTSAADYAATAVADEPRYHCAKCRDEGIVPVGLSKTAQSLIEEGKLTREAAEKNATFHNFTYCVCYPEWGRRHLDKLHGQNRKRRENPEEQEEREKQKKKQWWE